MWFLSMHVSTATCLVKLSLYVVLRLIFMKNRLINYKRLSLGFLKSQLSFEEMFKIEHFQFLSRQCVNVSMCEPPSLKNVTAAPFCLCCAVNRKY